MKYAYLSRLKNVYALNEHFLRQEHLWFLCSITKALKYLVKYILIFTYDSIGLITTVPSFPFDLQCLMHFKCTSHVFLQAFVLQITILQSSTNIPRMERVITKWKWTMETDMKLWNLVHNYFKWCLRQNSFVGKE